ncbi:retrotransposon protein, putative, ty1-copia subclass [Tanacetum coccineum]
MTRKPFPHRTETATDLLGLIHTDVCGPLRHVSRQGASYFITFTDDYSRYGYVYLLKHKHEVFETFNVFKNEVENQLENTIKALRSDRGETATRILNMVPTKKVDKTPYELWYGKVSNLSYLKVWGCEALVKWDTPEKLQQRSVKYAEFLEKNILPQEVNGRAKEIEEIQDKDTSPSENTSKIPLEVEEVEDHSLGDLNEPTNYKAAMLDPESDKLLEVNGFFKKKTDMDGIVHTYKACLVAKGYTQTYGVDYEETFSPVADIRVIRILIAIAVMDTSKRCYISMQERLNLNKTQGALTPEEVKRMKNVPYASAVGSIINTKEMFLVYGGNPKVELRVDCYCDAGFETNRDDIKSQIGYVFILNGGLVDWKSSKQSTTAMSATEAEYIAASEAAIEAVWIRKFISGLGIIPTINKPIKMLCNNSAALLIANELGVQKGTRHYNRRYHYVRECVELGEINLLKVHTYANLADPFTKALSKGKLTQHARSMGLRLASSFM